eukprot:IDg1981t1
MSGRLRTRSRSRRAALGTVSLLLYHLQFCTLSVRLKYQTSHVIPSTRQRYRRFDRLRNTVIVQRALRMCCFDRMHGGSSACVLVPPPRRIQCSSVYSETFASLPFCASKSIEKTLRKRAAVSRSVDERHARCLTVSRYLPQAV